MKIDEKWLRERIKAKKLTLAALATRWKLAAPQLTRRVKGETPFRAEELADLAKLLGEPIEELYRAVGLDVVQAIIAPAPVQVTGWVDAKWVVHRSGLSARDKAPALGLPGVTGALQVRTEGATGPAAPCDGWWLYLGGSVAVAPGEMGAACLKIATGAELVRVIVKVYAPQIVMAGYFPGGAEGKQKVEFTELKPILACRW